MTIFPSERRETENATEYDIVQFMTELGWRPTRNHVGLFTTSYGAKIKIGEKGFPDWTFTRGLHGHGHATIEQMHVEAKRPGEKPNKKQSEVLASLNYLGELAVWADSLIHFKVIYGQYFPAEVR